MSVRRNVIASCLGSGWAGVLALAVLPLYVGYLGIESFGLIGFFSTLQAWLFLLDMGLASTVNREMARFSAGLHTPQSVRDLVKSVEIVYGCVAVILALIVATFSFWLASNWLTLKSLSSATVSQALSIMGLVIASQWMGTLYRSTLLGLQHQVWISLITAVVATVRAAGTVAVLAFVSPTIAAFLVFQGGVSIAETVFLAWFVRRKLPLAPQSPRFTLAALRRVWRFAAGLAAITILATLLTQVDKLLLAKLLPLDQFGYFSFAVTIAGAVSLLIAPIYNVAFPRLTELVAAGDKAKLSKEYHRFAQLLSIIILPATLIISVFSKEIIFLWTRDAATTQSVAPIMSVWAAGTALNGLMHLPYAAQIAHGWARLAIFANLIAVLIIIPAVLFWVPKHGAIAAAWIWVTINAAFTILVIGAMHTRILEHDKWRWYVQDIGYPLAAGISATLVIYLVHAAQNSMTRSAEFIFFLTGILFSTLLAALSTPLGRETLSSTTRSLGRAR